MLFFHSMLKYHFWGAKLLVRKWFHKKPSWPGRHQETQRCLLWTKDTQHTYRQQTWRKLFCNGLCLHFRSESENPGEQSSTCTVETLEKQNVETPSDLWSIYHTHQVYRIVILAPQSHALLLYIIIYLSLFIGLHVILCYGDSTACFNYYLGRKGVDKIAWIESLQIG